MGYSKPQKRRESNHYGRSGKGVDVPGTTLVFQVTQFRNPRSSLPWTDHIAVAAFSTLKAASTFIDFQVYPEQFRIDRKNLVKLGDAYHVVSAYPYRVSIDNPKQPKVILDATGLRASPVQQREHHGKANKSIRYESVQNGGSGDQGSTLGIDSTDVPDEERPFVETREERDQHSNRECGEDRKVPDGDSRG